MELYYVCGCYGSINQMYMICKTNYVNVDKQLNNLTNTIESRQNTDRYIDFQ